MLFYAGLTVAGIIAAAVVVWIVRSLSVAGHSAYSSLSPSRQKPGSARLAHLNSNLAATPAPWGWGDGGHQRKQRKPKGSLKTRAYSQYKGAEAARTATQQPAGPDALKTGSVRNVLTGYDIHRKSAASPSKPDTSCWPYRDNFERTTSSVPTEVENEVQESDQPTKPWGW